MEAPLNILGILGPVYDLLQFCPTVKGVSNLLVSTKKKIQQSRYTKNPSGKGDASVNESICDLPGCNSYSWFRKLPEGPVQVFKGCVGRCQ